MNTIRQGLTEHRMPGYVEEVLSNNYCPYFISMTIIKDQDSYKFSYRPGNLKRLDIKALDTYSKCVLLRTLITISNKASVHLITPDSFLIEPELMYTSGNRVTIDSLKILYYPDVKCMKFAGKLRLFAGRILSEQVREEREFLEQFRNSLEGGDINRASLLLDKNILRMETRIVS